MRITVEEAARRLELHPAEVVSLLLSHRQPMPGFTIPEELLPTLAAWAGLEQWWTEDAQVEGQEDAAEADPRHDPDPYRRVVRWLPWKLLQKGKVGGSHTRVDNAWRGLPGELRGFAKEVVALMKREGLLRTKPTLNGEHISLEPQALDAVHALIAWRNPPAPFVRLLDERS